MFLDIVLLCSSGAVAEHIIHIPVVEGSNTTTTDKGREKRVKKVSVIGDWNRIIWRSKCFGCLFSVGDTFEMRTSRWFKTCISIDKLRMLARVFISNTIKRGIGKEAERPRESESECVSAGWWQPKHRL